jgi:molybdopterin converting factor subunit 1
MNQVTVQFFATIRELTGTRQVRLELPDGATVASAKQMLIDKFPSLAQAMDTSVVAVNREFSPDEDLLPEGAEIAIFPPVSGGSGGENQELPTIFSITNAEIDLNQLLKQITLPGSGAGCLFTGMVRGITHRGDPHETTYLEYEAYQPMAEEKMRQVADEIRQRWPTVQGVAIIQRIGRLDPGTPTVLIACTAAHRDTGVFEAARYGIDRLKEIVPVWKKEVGPEGQTWVEGDYYPSPND